MASSPRQNHEYWSGRIAFILAASGSAIGLGNIWKFPYITGEHGGGAFVLIYLFCIALIGLPVLMAEIIIGRRGGAEPVGCVRALAKEAGKEWDWGKAILPCLVCAFVIVSFYSVIGGWAVGYLQMALEGKVHAATDSEKLFNEFISSPLKTIILHSIFMVMTLWVVAGGIRKGIERAVNILMPVLLVLLLILLFYSFFSGGFQESFTFLFKPDFSKVSGETFLVAAGHAFFTLSVGTVIMVAYGSFLPKRVSVTEAAVTVVILDTVVALVAGLTLFSLAFANELSPGAGPGLVFVTIPHAFSATAGGLWMSILFFFLLVFAAWSSAISLIEPVVERVEEHFNLSRKQAVAIAGGGAWLLGIPCALSFNAMAGFTLPSFVPLLGGFNFFDTLDYVSSNILLPYGGLIVALFAGWVMSSHQAKDELHINSPWAYNAWRKLIRVPVPAAIVVILLYGIFG